MAKPATIVHGEEDLDTARRHGAQYFYTALGWRCRLSPRRKRREVIRTDTSIPVPIVEDPLLIPSTVPDNLDTSWYLPDSRSSASVPVVGLASVAIPELHPLDGNLQLSSRRGWARLGEQFRPRVRAQLRNFFILGKSAKNPFARLICTFFITSWREREKKMNQEDFHEKQGQRSAPQSAQKCASW